ncbi:thiol methyltransferase-like protein [Emericellopsis cladophorae]|uniref:Thiol methyltransferase-like protein n=1 Tax=Emericellopsis cladophorae TaxID=2686198 RepID=A0A9Q0BGW2_9HYPO|nr:thiol methyltransferase-like protein [Emericellopsis cladophorae]KAI6784401.1 thiol methyltransferase-like protein [Emericellopsis cladophorae]
MPQPEQSEQPEQLGPLATAFKDLPADAHPEQWNAFYEQAHHPWDRAGPSLALKDLLLQRPDLVPPPSPGATALVPGCGLGHDALLLASLGYDAWGLDVSETGLAMARRNEQAQRDEGYEQYPVREGHERGRVHWVRGDFFADDWAAGAGGPFDLIFDYTFLCALPLDLRPRWAKQVTHLLAPRGRLVCLEFPVGKPHRDIGPPWGLNPEVYEALLATPGEPLHYDARGDGTVVSAPSPKPRDDALHRLSLIKPLRTHKAGYYEDGTVRDFVSVWSR